MSQEVKKFTGFTISNGSDVTDISIYETVRMIATAGVKIYDWLSHYIEITSDYVDGITIFVTDWVMTAWLTE